MATLEEVTAVQDAFGKWLETHPNPDVNGYGIGKTDDGAYCLRVNLVDGSGRKKLPLSFHGVQVYFDVTGIPRAQDAKPRKGPLPPKQGPRREFLLDRMPRHRFIVVELHLKRNRGGIRAGAVDALNRFARANVLSVVKVDDKTGVAYLSATPSTLEWAFSPQDAGRNTVGKRMQMSIVRVDGQPCRTVDQSPWLPDYLATYVKFIGGFDTRPGARLMVPAKPAIPEVKPVTPEAGLAL